MSENPVRRKFSRHIDIRRFFVRDRVSAGVLQLVPLRTHLMVVDPLTKSLCSPAQIKHREIMLGPVPFSFACSLFTPCFWRLISFSFFPCCDRGSLL
jgi:hypothetical protein